MYFTWKGKYIPIKEIVSNISLVNFVVNNVGVKILEGF